MKKIPERKGMRMKENRKLLKEVLKDIQDVYKRQKIVHPECDRRVGMNIFDCDGIAPARDFSFAAVKRKLFL